MCIAITSPIGTEIPTDDILRTCFRNNSDGAGFAFNTDNNQVQIVKGFMDFESFITAFHEYDKKYCFKDRGVLIHCRITTQGGTNPNNCHPFPISNNPKHLKKLKITSDYAVIHNGIIQLCADSKNALSDTMLFIKDYLSKLSSNKGWFYNKNNIKLIHELIDSKMAILNGKGEILATPGFTRGEDGNYYSNSSYKSLRYCLYDYGYCGGWYDELFYDTEEECECPLMRLKKDEVILYDDGTTEEFESGYHNIYPIYLTKEGDVYGDYVDSIDFGRVSMENLTYLGSGCFISAKDPFNIVEFRKDVTGYI